MSLEYDSKALAEVHYVLTFLDDDNYNKIPSRLINYVKKNMDKKIAITEEMIKEENILPDAQELLSLIYTEYLYDETSDGPIYDEAEEAILKEMQSVSNKLEENNNNKVKTNNSKNFAKDYSNKKKKNRKDKRNRKKGSFRKDKYDEDQKSLLVKRESLFERILKNINKVIQNIF